MTSIRHSLIAYFLILLALALVAIGLLIDRFAHDTIRSRHEAETKRIEQEYDFRCQEESAQFDAELLKQAQRLGAEFRRTYLLLTGRSFEDWQKYRAYYFLLQHGLTANAPGLTPFVTTSLLGHTSISRPLVGMISSTSRMDDIRHSFESSGYTDSFQFHIPRWKQVMRAPRQHADLPSDVELYGLNENTEHHSDTIQMPGVGPMRRVIYRTSLLNTNRSPNFPSGRGGRPPSGGPDRPRPESPVRPEPSPAPPPIPLDVLFPPLYVQTVRPMTDLEERNEGFAALRDKQLETVEEGTRQSINKLRTKVMTISLFTFISLAIGGWLLVGVGLAPLRKFSDAAGRVSEKDFRLPVERADLSSELVPIHDRLTHSLEALRLAFDREKQAVADISHELRTPVAALLATMDVSLRKPRTVEQYKTTIEECRIITKQLGTLVERVMTLAYLDAGHATAAERDTNLMELAQGCATVIRPLAEAQGISVSSELETISEIRTDPDKLREVMMNLLHNAVEYNRPGGNIALRLRGEHNGGAVLEVCDTGIGMTNEVKSRIFERFYRADESRTTTGVHAGLGLAIVKEYVNRMGGTIAVESEPGHGTTFRVTLPNHEPEA